MADNAISIAQQGMKNREAFTGVDLKNKEAKLPSPHKVGKIPSLL
ncbi:hypothetical protein P4N68_05850 [Corynebacterium felinum]|uniref:Uncharacterized protein n=1 Tax=Corynebacterium felinum TaxID=131318 RepID=A0ABU2B6B7_9CORY|nr:hypothetical protein [Corynebacterium felinum]MDF5820601.1 hypothetical protein [Corynebacterium felinum]MDR7354162.1 hypothetical protein [Corynebacterium felinum]